MNKLLLLTILTLSLASASPIQDLINSYSFDHTSDTINISEITDLGGSNSLYFHINISEANPDQYTFYIDLQDTNGIISGKGISSYPSLSNSAIVIFDCHDLSGKTQFNYTLRIYDSNNSLIYRKGNFTTKTYIYNSGYEIQKIQDSNINNDHIQLNLTLNSSLTTTKNISTFLQYNNKTISLKKQTTLQPGTNNILFELDNEIIKSTHHNGAYNISKILIGDKIMAVDHLTSNYNFEDFAKTSYLTKINASPMDMTGNGLADFLGIDFQINVKESGEYFVEAYVYDATGQYLTTISGKENLTTGNQKITTKINGSLIYSLKNNGPYILSIASLSDEQDDVDFLREVEIGGNFSYEDFERPNLSDLEIRLNKNNITIKNTGTATAFNVEVKVFANSTYEETFVISRLNASEEYTIELNYNESFVGEILIAIVDFNNLIEEKNESNNIFSLSTSEPSIPSILEIISLSPEKNYSTTNSESNLACVYNSSVGISLANLYGDFNGIWKLIESKDISGFFGTISFAVDLSIGVYSWNCEVVDIENKSSFYFENYTINITEESNESSDDDSSSSSSSKSKGKPKEVVQVLEPESFNEEIENIQLQTSFQPKQESKQEEIILLMAITILLLLTLILLFL
ncbi:hypothetical protein HNV12_02400 [Methanococcoides sp. SA1]|nr:hypothetical protein [Methanococcoides sp. SA1]